MDMREKIEQAIVDLQEDNLTRPEAIDAIIAALRKQEAVAHNFGKPLGYAVVTNSDCKVPNMLDGGAHTFRSEAEKVCNSKDYAGTHHIVELWPLYALPIPPVEQADEIHKLRQGLRRIAEMIDRDGKAIEMHLQVHLKELCGISRAALSEQRPGEKS